MHNLQLMPIQWHAQGDDVVFCGFSTFQVQKYSYSASHSINLAYFSNDSGKF